MFGNLVKRVVDVKKALIAIDAEIHADQEAFLIKNGSEQSDLWGINFHPDNSGSEDFVEFDSMINLRPRQNNRSRSVEDLEIRKRIQEIVNECVAK